MKQDQKFRHGVAATIALLPIATVLAAACGTSGGNEAAGAGLGGNGQGGVGPYGGQNPYGGVGATGTAGSQGGTLVIGGGTGGNPGGGAQGTGGFVGNTAQAPLPPQVDRCMGAAAQF